MKKILLSLVIVCSTACMVHAQKTEDLLQRKNTIKLELMSTVLYRKAYIFSYERVTKPNQSFSISAGYQEFPKLTSFGSNIKSLNGVSKSGFKLGGEYRFYL